MIISCLIFQDLNTEWTILSGQFLIRLKAYLFNGANQVSASYFKDKHTQTS